MTIRSIRESTFHASVAGALVLLVSGCGRVPELGPPITGPLKLYSEEEGKEKIIPVNLLLQGQEDYTLYCRACHGENGDGRGPAGIGLRPPPRNFTEPVFKFGGVEAGNLPPDSEIKRIIKHGLHGTAMLPWDIADPTLDGIIAYIKVFSPVWTEEEPIEPVEITEDPWKGKVEDAQKRGSVIYHGLAKCLACHPAYATKQEIWDAEVATTGSGAGAFRPNMYDPEAKFSEAFKHSLLPPDFLRHPIKAGHTAHDLFRTIGSGISGTAMPMWKGALPDEDIWALSHFVEGLAELKNTPKAREMRNAWLNQPEWTPPTAPAEGEAPTE